MERGERERDREREGGSSNSVGEGYWVTVLVQPEGEDNHSDSIE